MNEDTLVKLALVRYILIPRQLLAFDDAYGKDSYEFNKFFLTNGDNAVSVASKFLAQVEAGDIGSAYDDKCGAIISFVTSLPFVDISSFSDLNSYNPFDDFESQEVDNYFLGDHFPSDLEVEEDEASIFYVNRPEEYYQWYKALNDYSLVALLTLYITLLQELSYKGDK